MVRQVQVTVPLEELGRVQEVLQNHRWAHGLAVMKGDTQALLIVKCTEKRLRSILNRLLEIGVTKNGTIDILQLSSTVPSLKHYDQRPGNRKREYRMDNRLTIEEITQTIDSQIHLTFDFLIFIIIAAAIASAGLVQDNGTTIVASMIASPLMAPIMGFTFGMAIRD
eukprot:Colp12_sorted_trinity150504_noHs@5752